MHTVEMMDLVKIRLRLNTKEIRLVEGRDFTQNGVDGFKVCELLAGYVQLMPNILRCNVMMVCTVCLG